MRLLLNFCFIIAVQTIDPSLLKFAMKAFLPIGDGVLFNMRTHDSSSTARRSDDVGYSERLYRFLNASFNCSSDEAKNAAPDLLTIVDTIWQLPFIKYIISDETKYNIINAVKKCANELQENPNEAEPNLKARKKKVGKFFTGVIEDNVASAEPDDGTPENEREEPDENAKNDFKALIDDIVEVDSGTDPKLVKLVLDIGDNLKSELNKNRELREMVLGKDDDGVLSVNDISFRANAGDSTDEEDAVRRDGDDAVVDIERRDVKKEFNDDIVFNNNMEIFVRMNKGEGT